MRSIGVIIASVLFSGFLVAQVMDEGQGKSEIMKRITPPPPLVQTEKPSGEFEVNIAYSLAWFPAYADFSDKTELNNGFTISAFYRFYDPSVVFGLETGFMFWSYSSIGDLMGVRTTLNATAYTIPIIFTGGYVWKDLAGIRDFDCYFNLGVGPAIIVQSYNFTGGLYVNTSKNLTVFDFVATPGIRYLWFYLEPKFGTLNAGFLFELNFGLHF